MFNSRSEQENQVWERMLAKYGTYGMAMRIMKSKAYRAYIQARPYDEHEAVFSLDALTEAGYAPPSGERPVLEDIASDETVREFLQTLTPKQRRILSALLQGFKPSDIYEREGYRNTGGIRYHKFIIRKKWLSFLASRESQ